MIDLQSRASQIETDYVRRFKEGGGKVVGYACVATPVEVLEAAGLLPYRIKAFGHPDTSLGDSYLSRFNCRFCRSCLSLGLDGTYDFLDGLVETNGCDHLRGMFENWQYAKKLPYFHYLKVPHRMARMAMERLWEEEGRRYGFVLLGELSGLLYLLEEGLLSSREETEARLGALGVLGGRFGYQIV